MSSEKQLIEKARAFDIQSLAEIYDQYSPQLHRYAVRLIGDSDHAEECVAETFSRFLHALQRGGGPKEHLQAYLYRIAHNWITDFFRKQPPLPLETAIVAQPDPGTDPQAVAVDVHLRSQVRVALMKLTPAQRQVITLKFIEGWSNKEIAKAIRKPVGAVKSLQHRALGAMNRHLSEVVSE
jgi:RNA polymerase sigma-70 factor (ECF subfamily)